MNLNFVFDDKLKLIGRHSFVLRSLFANVVFIFVITKKMVIPLI